MHQGKGYGSNSGGGCNLYNANQRGNGLDYTKQNTSPGGGPGPLGYGYHPHPFPPMAMGSMDGQGRIQQYPQGPYSPWTGPQMAGPLMLMNQKPPNNDNNNMYWGQAPPCGQSPYPPPEQPIKGALGYPPRRNPLSLPKRPQTDDEGDEREDEGTKTPMNDLNNNNVEGVPAKSNNGSKNGSKKSISKSKSGGSRKRPKPPARMENCRPKPQPVPDLPLPKPPNFEPLPLPFLLPPPLPNLPPPNPMDFMYQQLAQAPPPKNFMSQEVQCEPEVFCMQMEPPCQPCCPQQFQRGPMFDPGFNDFGGGMCFCPNPGTAPPPFLNHQPASNYVSTSTQSPGVAMPPHCPQPIPCAPPDPCGTVCFQPNGQTCVLQNHPCDESFFCQQPWEYVPICQPKSCCWDPQSCPMLEDTQSVPAFQRCFTPMPDNPPAKEFFIDEQSGILYKVEGVCCSNEQIRSIQNDCYPDPDMFEVIKSFHCPVVQPPSVQPSRPTLQCQSQPMVPPGGDPPQVQRQGSEPLNKPWVWEPFVNAAVSAQPITLGQSQNLSIIAPVSQQTSTTGNVQGLNCREMSTQFSQSDLPVQAPNIPPPLLYCPSQPDHCWYHVPASTCDCACHSGPSSQDHNAGENNPRENKSTAVTPNLDKARSGHSLVRFNVPPADSQSQQQQDGQQPRGSEQRLASEQQSKMSMIQPVISVQVRFEPPCSCERKKSIVLDECQPIAEPFAMLSRTNSSTPMALPMPLPVPMQAQSLHCSQITCPSIPQCTICSPCNLPPQTCPADDWLSWNVIDTGLHELQEALQELMKLMQDDKGLCLDVGKAPVCCPDPPGIVSFGAAEAARGSSGSRELRKFSTDVKSSGNVPNGKKSSGDVLKGKRSSGDVLKGKRSSGEVLKGKRSSGEVLKGKKSSGDVLKRKKSSVGIAAGKKCPRKKRGVLPKQNPRCT